MGESPVADLRALDRDVARAEAALAAWRKDLAADPAAHADEHPLEPLRHVAGQSTYRALGELAPSAADVPLRDALREWVAALLLARVGREAEARAAVSAGEERARFHGASPRRVSWRQAWRGVAEARSPIEARLWLDAAVEAGPGVADAHAARARRRLEASLRLGLAHPWEVLTRAAPSDLRAAAERLLAGTDELTKALHGPTEGEGPAARIHAAVGREAGEGWPSRLGARWLEDAFAPSLGTLRPVLGALPQALGASSFARALGQLGFAVQRALAPGGAPFALTREPGSREAHRLGFVFAALAADPAWQMRVLGVGRRTADAQARLLGRTMLLDARLHAARLLLGDESAFAPRERFEELGHRVFGAPLDPRLRGAWPAARDDEATRWVGLLEAGALARELREQFDSDWFRNPRAWGHLRALASTPSPKALPGAALLAAAEELGRTFEEVLG